MFVTLSSYQTFHLHLIAILINITSITFGINMIRINRHPSIANMSLSSSVVVLVVLLCLSLVSVTSGAPTFSHKYDKPGQLFKYPGHEHYYNKNYIPKEDIIADWNNPWNFNRDMMLPNFGSWMNRENTRVSRDGEDRNDEDDSDKETVRKRSLNKWFRLFKKSLDSNSNNQEKRNFVPMLG